MTNDNVTAPPESDFLATLANDSIAVSDANAELTAVLQGIRNTGAKGAVSVTLNFTPNKNDETIMEITATVKSVVPKRKPKPKIMYVQHDGSLGDRDPNAIVFEDIREAPARVEPAAIKEARR